MQPLSLPPSRSQSLLAFHFLLESLWAQVETQAETQAGAPMAGWLKSSSSLSLKQDNLGKSLAPEALAVRIHHTQP